MKSIWPRLIVLAAGILGVPYVANGLDFKDGPFDGTAFRPNASISWGVTSTLPKTFTAYRPIAEKVTQAVISNAMAIGSFKSINLVRSQDKNLIEFRDTPREQELTRFLKVTANRGWVRYYDRSAEKRPVHGIPSFEEADKQVLRYLSLLGCETNQVSLESRSHNEGTFESYDKPGGRLIAKGISSRSVCLFRQIDGMPVLGNSLSVDFGNDAKPIMLEMNWPPFQPAQQYRTATRDEILKFLKSGRAFYPVWPEQSNVSSAKVFTVKSIQPLYKRGLGTDPQGLLRPYASLGMEADVGGKLVKFGLNCPIITDEKVR